MSACALESQQLCIEKYCPQTLAITDNEGKYLRPGCKAGGFWRKISFDMRQTVNKKHQHIAKQNYNVHLSTVVHAECKTLSAKALNSHTIEQVLINKFHLISLFYYVSIW